jgi:DNA (cytosine-5)-methyltransferase 1
MVYESIELFAGAGGLALGLENSGIKHNLLVEVDKDCVETLRNNRPQWNVKHADIKDVSFEGMKADIVTGGFPCQAFSHAGKKLGFKDTRGTLFFEFARCVKEVKPKICVAENVEGLLRHDKGRTLETMINVLSGFGYEVKYKVLNSVNFEVPQKRRRLIIVGTKDGINFNFPRGSKKVLTIGDALKDVPKSPGLGYSENKKKVLDLVPPGGCWVNLPEDVKKDYMGKSLYSGGGKRGMARRMSWDEPCLTLTTSPCQKQTERCHPEETRPFTVREYARIQTFPDDWEFSGSLYSQYKQIGNAVPVKLAENVGKQIIKALKSKNSKKEVQSTLNEVIAK